MCKKALQHDDECGQVSFQSERDRRGLSNFSQLPISLSRQFPTGFDLRVPLKIFCFVGPVYLVPVGSFTASIYNLRRNFYGGPQGTGCKFKKLLQV